MLLPLAEDYERNANNRHKSSSTKDEKTNRGKLNKRKKVFWPHLAAEGLLHEWQKQPWHHDVWRRRRKGRGGGEAFESPWCENYIRYMGNIQLHIHMSVIVEYVS